jgi:hypothetical protein
VQTVTDPKEFIVRELDEHPGFFFHTESMAYQCSGFEQRVTLWSKTFLGD